MLVLVLAKRGLQRLVQVRQRVIAQVNELLFNQGLQGYTGFDPTNPSRLSTVNTVDPNVKAPITHEFLVGMDKELLPNFSVSGTATSGTDFTSIGTTVTFAANSATADKDVAALPDNAVEDPETVIATVTCGTGYSVGRPASATVTITADGFQGASPVVDLYADVEANFALAIR